MVDTDAQWHEAQRLAAEAPRLHDQGAYAKAIGVLRRAMLLCAEVERQSNVRDQPSPLRDSIRARICELYGDYLTESGGHAEAASVYQEASDIYGRSAQTDLDPNVRRCAHKALDSITALRARPRDRLYLLIGQYERQQRQLALQAGTQEQQGACCLHIAGILLRRDRPEEAVTRYQQALSLFALAPQTQSALLSSAECHHRIAGLFAYALADLAAAARHYNAAIAIYSVHEAPVYGLREQCALCLRALEDVESLMRSLPRHSILE